ncbi:serine hydrolase domain-containing protein [Streptococcus sanguinis]|uniref:FmtA-like protein n=1 Tax=Streptococcus sanguinis TaxID=1305 RepID=A0A2X3XMG3_STRSA|nr:serine hydrolase domain-containing protein [Streptococcus sanguinis]EGJ42480.1 FmtA family protein [Streptococcus sanguinis SK1059]EGQ18475.1 FmtA family protein [Streptococcus sanguinis ATCC 29667]EGQ25395.1 FmtA family protein [Streptococcus sanguinis SK340]SQF35852.1 FmtA-like protein [Streptococcus sanguinis]
MKKSFILTLLTIITLGLFQPATALAEEAQKLPSGIERDQIGQKIQDYVKEHEKTTAGIATAVFDKDGTIYKGNFGYMDKEKGIKADDDSVFEWGSVTKLTIWLSVMQLWEQGKINLEEDIHTYLPEGFLKNLRYDKPITMLDLMNHQAGFDETTFYMRSDKSIEEILQEQQPIQSFEPGTVTAYSNYGAGLAALIVERISGQTFADYAHEHIFQPLGMNKTAILPDLSDNSYVQKKRQETKGYDTKGNLLSKDHFITSIYPIGAATGTLKDLEKFAQALLARKTLFERPETWNTLYTASSTYPDTDIIRNAHGFWANEYGTTVLGHGGNTAGATSRIMLDLEHGIGYVVMTNQGAEQNYNFQMPELVFGPRKTASKETQEQFSPGYYRTLRNFNQGPLAIFKMIPASADYLHEPSDDQRLPNNFWTIYQSQGKTHIAVAVADYEKVSDFDFFKDYVVLSLAGLGIIYALGLLLISPLLGAYRLIFRKKQDQPDRTWKVWNLLTAVGILAVPINLFLLFMSAISGDFSEIAQWRYMLFAALGLLLTAAALLPLFRKSREKLSKGRLFLTAVTSLSALAVAANILYWSLYQWWVF